MTPELAHIITAPCFPSELNNQFDNPDIDPPCKCDTCLQPPISSTPPSQTLCNCSGPECDPEPTLPPLPRSRHTQQMTIPMDYRLTDEM